MGRRGWVGVIWPEVVYAEGGGPQCRGPVRARVDGQALPFGGRCIGKRKNYRNRAAESASCWGMERMKTYLVLVCVLIAIGAGGLAWRERALKRQTEAALAGAEARIAALERKLQAVTAAAREVPPAPAGGATTASAQPARMSRRGEPMDFANDPEIAPLMLKQRQRQIATRYALLFARLGLPAAQREQLLALLADKQLSHFDAMGLARRQGLGRDDAMELAKQADMDADGAIRALLGDTAFAQLQDYDRTYAQRTTVNTLATQLGYAGAALSAEQQEKLIQVMADHAVVDAPAGSLAPFGGPGGPGGRMPFGPGADQAEIRSFFESKVASDAEALQQASTFLTAAQLEAVRQAQEAETEQLRLAALRVDRMRRSFGGGR